MSAVSGHDVEQYQGYTIVYDEGPTNWGAYVDGLPTPSVCFTVADTREECTRQIHEALTVYRESLQRDKHERPWLYVEAAPTASTAS